MKRTQDLEDHKRELTNAGINIMVVGYAHGWRFERQTSYWSAQPRNHHEKGLKLSKAQEMHDKKYPYKMFDDCHITTYGEVIRVQGHAGAPPPEEWVVFDWDNVNKQIDELKIDRKGLTTKMVEDMIKDGTLKGDLYVKTYHIDTQEGLNEFIRVIGSR